MRVVERDGQKMMLCGENSSMPRAPWVETLNGVVLARLWADGSISITAGLGSLAAIKVLEDYREGRLS